MHSLDFVTNLLTNDKAVTMEVLKPVKIGHTWKAVGTLIWGSHI